MLARQSLKFYLARLKNASLSELVHRIREAATIWRLRARFARGGLCLKILSIDYAAAEGLRLPDFQYCLDDKVRGALLEGKVFTLNGDRERIERFETESRGVFWADVPRAAPDFDIRMVWEPARLQHLTILLLYAHTHRGPELDRLQLVVKNAILDWIEKNPFLSGPHYQSAMECGLRIPVFFYALKYLDNLEPNEKNRIFETIYQHAWWISRRLSLHSSLGNHTVCEAAGLVFAGAIFGSQPEGRAWMGRGLSLLRQELCHQFLDDGGPAEQSLGYGRFVLDLYWLVVDFLEKNRLHDCRDWKPRLVLGENFLNAFQDGQGQLPGIGDYDDGNAVAPGIHPKRDIEY
jgi:hypothetical protein